MTMHHISASLKIIIESSPPEKVKQQIRCYNITLSLICVVALVAVLVMSFYPHEIQEELVLGLSLATRVVILIFYSCTVFDLMKKLHHLPISGMQ
jgi:hypothetical protein